MVDTGSSIKVLDRKTFSKMVDVTLARTTTKAFSLQYVTTRGFCWQIPSTGANKETLCTCNIFFVEDDDSGNLMSAQTAQ